MLKNPCYGCEKRELGCHSRCEEHQEYKKKVDEAREKRLSEIKAFTDPDVRYVKKWRQQ